MPEVSELSIRRSGNVVATLCLDRPRTRNALSIRALEELLDGLQRLGNDRAVRVVVLSATGDIFSSGADLTELADPRNFAPLADLVSRVVAEISTMPQPVVCQVNGDAYGAGLAVLSAADITIADRRARFAVPEVRHGMVPTVAAACCVRRIGVSAALDLFLTGRRFGADEAHQLGLITAAVDGADLSQAVDQRVEDLLRADAEALTRTKQLVRQLSGPTLAEALSSAMAVGAPGRGAQERGQR
jgi:methylglutaconyl-CoA hydratase